VTAITRQTRQRSETVEDYFTTFKGRLAALARVHDMITNDGQEDANLLQIVCTELKAHGARQGKDFRVDGPEVELAPRHAQGLILAVHELVTNALKYGALHHEGGSIENFRCFGEGDRKFVLELADGLTTLVGENDIGKTAVIDALRFALGTRDQEYMRVEDRDFHWPRGADERRKEIRTCCKFDGLTAHDKAAFAEYLTYVERDGRPDAVLYVNWTARHGAGVRGTRRFVSVEVRSGEAGDGPILDAEARNLLCATYLRPLRDAERALAAGRGSRLSQILQFTREVKEHGTDFDRETTPNPDPDTLSVLGVGDYASALLENREGIRAARKRLNDDYLKPLSFKGDALSGHIGVSISGEKEARLRQLLEKLELEIRSEDAQASANRGLGSNNLLFMACELLLLGSEATEFPLLLIEEPEAHLHPQRPHSRRPSSDM
jgi:putative ATP-dependent endonuclease of the OLD family